MESKIYRVIVWVVATLFVVYSFCLNTAAAVFSGAVKTSLHAQDFEISLSMAAFILGFACMQIPAGYLLDKYNPRWVVSSGVLLLAAGNLMISYATGLIYFSLANFLQGLGAAYAFIAIGVLISQWFSAKAFPILFGLTQSVSCIFSGIIHYFFTLALKNYSWNQLYQKLAIFGFLLLILTVVFIKSPKHYQPALNLSLKKSLHAVLTNKQIRLCALAAATSFGVLLGYSGFWYLRIQEYYAVENLQAVIVSGIIFAGIGVGTPLLGFISNLVKSRVAVLHVTLVLGVMALLVGIYLPHYAINTLIIIKIVSFFIGFFLSGSMLFYTIVSEVSSNATRGVALSVTNTAVFLFNTLIIFVPYLFVTSTSNLFFTYLWLLPFCVMFSLLLLYFIKDKRSCL
ncbi:MAG TPA: MFS transporter [Gammaproteobacteria bacterium]|nr:MFS transporter [Gammaproteobacteria bacterium]